MVVVLLPYNQVCLNMYYYSNLQQIQVTYKFMLCRHILLRYGNNTDPGAAGTGSTSVFVELTFAVLEPVASQIL